jgi:hypothetical protein
MRSLAIAITILVSLAVCPIAVLVQASEGQEEHGASTLLLQQRGSVLSFHVANDNSHVVADVYTLSGKHLARVLDELVSHGNYSLFPLSQCNVSSQAFIVCLSDGKQTDYIRMLNLSGVRMASMQPTQKFSGGLNKIAADTMVTLSTGVFQFPNALPGRKITAKKVFDPSISGTRVITDATDVADMSALEVFRSKEWQLIRAKYGCLSQSLREKFASSSFADDVVSVKIHPKMPPFTYPDRTAPVAVLKAKSLEAVDLEPLVSIDTIIKRYKSFGNFGKVDRRNCSGSIKIRDLANLIFDNDIGSIEEEVITAPTANVLPFYTLASEAKVSRLPSSCQGQNVNAATFESGLLPSFISCTGIAPQSGVLETTTNEYDHTEMCFTCLINAAPLSKFYHHISTIYDDVASENFLINNNINTVSCSWTRTSDADNFEMLTIDDFTYRYPSPVFCNPADNNALIYPYEYVNWGCYNAISVGAAKYASPHYVQDDWSTWCNPPPKWGPVVFTVSGSGDREMPYVVAPGSQPNEPEGTWDPTNYQWSDNCCHYFNPPADARGTSFSAPLVNGIAADVISSSSDYTQWPEKVRATIILTAMNVNSGYWSADSYDGADGAGAISGIDAVSFGLLHTIVSGPNGAAATSGQYGGFMTSADQLVTKTFNIAIPSSLPSGKHLRVVLTWDANPDLTTTFKNYLSDLDLFIRDNHNNLIGSSASWDGNVEMVDIPSSNCTPNTVYTAIVNPINIRIPTAARMQGFWYCVAWTWVKDHAP